MLDYSKSFIETQFPVSKISKESYKERKAVHAQTLTPLGKWWGRKPLILVRATLLGTLMPISDNSIKDKDIFLKILTMDEEGLYRRKSKQISMNELKSILSKVELDKYFTEDLKSLKSNDDKDFIQKLAFNRLSYDDKLKYCDRPEQYTLADKAVWSEINKHLETNATSIQELIEQLGIKRFGHRPKVGDAFAGGGSIPFESARIGANVVASDLNPVAAILNYSSLNINGASKEEIGDLLRFMKDVYSSVEKDISDLGIDRKSNGDIAENFLYCTETKCPECGYRVPLSTSWIVVKEYGIVVNLVEKDGYFDFELITNANQEQKEIAENAITLKKNNLYCPHCNKETPISSIRGAVDEASFLWNKEKFSSEINDLFVERLFAIRYISSDGERYYVSPDDEDIDRELAAKKFMEDNFKSWQLNGYLPSSKIEDGEETSRLKRERGWQYWHQLFNTRQLIYAGLFAKHIFSIAKTRNELVVGILGLNKIIDWSSKLSLWDNSRNQSVKNTFLNQALNTLFNYGTRGLKLVSSSWFYRIEHIEIGSNNNVFLDDARVLNQMCDIWITDPPYADAVNYEQLSEFFLSWDKLIIEKAFPEWYTDSKRVLAVKGTGSTFNHSMIEVYKNLANHMPDNGYQVVMFTHQDVKVWSELSMILWSAGLRVVSAWNVATETESGGLKAGGNYVKGTVLLTLKKQTSNEIAFQDELYDEIKYEVKSIIDSMKALDDKDDPDFTDADYLLASYASSLKVLTAYKEIDGIDVEYWLSQPRDSKEENPVEALINKAVRIAYDYLIPEGFDTSLWKDLKPEERFYIRGLEVEMSGVAKISSYQELARGFGVSDYADMFASFKANSARLKTPSEYRMTFLNGNGFTSTLLRHLLVALYETTENKSTVEGRAYLKGVYQQDNQYWYKKPLMIELLSFIANLEFVDHMKHWHEHAYSAKILKEALKNEGV